MITSAPRDALQFSPQIKINMQIELYDEIGIFGIRAKNFIGSIRAQKPPKLTVNVNSPGGDVWDGLAIHAALSALPEVTMMIEGIAASMASLVAMAGGKIKIADSAFMMVHNPWTVAAGDAEALTETADLLAKLETTIANIYAKRSGQTMDTVKAWMAAETWFDAQEAVDAGLADEIVTAPQVKALAFDLSKFSKAPKALTGKAQKPTSPLLAVLAKEKLIASETISEEEAAAQIKEGLINRINSALPGSEPISPFSPQGVGGFESLYNSHMKRLKNLTSFNS